MLYITVCLVYNKKSIYFLNLFYFLKIYKNNSRLGIISKKSIKLKIGDAYMSFLKNFFIKPPESIEKKGNDYFDNNLFGPAKVEYEKALEKYKKENNKADTPEENNTTRVLQKILKCCESLALQHIKSGEQLIEADMPVSSDIIDEAISFFELALELTKDPKLIKKIEGYKKNIRQTHYEKNRGTDKIQIVQQVANVESIITSDSEDFNAIVASLPEEIAEEYIKYGENFKIGYLALSRGDFEMAVEKLTLSMDENLKNRSNYIPLELSTSLLNLGEVEKAEELIKDFVKVYPESINGCHLFCEICWELKEYEKAHNHLQLVLNLLTENDNLQSSLLQLKSETFYREEKFAESEAVCRQYLDGIKWDETIGLSLAKTLEAIENFKEAKDIYGKIIKSCAGCGKMPDFYLLKKFADLSYYDGDRSTEILEA